jgi:hypothetical protein
MAMAMMGTGAANGIEVGFLVCGFSEFLSIYIVGVWEWERAAGCCLLAGLASSSLLKNDTSSISLAIKGK